MKQNIIDLAILLIAIVAFIYCIMHAKIIETIFTALLIAYVLKSIIHDEKPNNEQGSER